MSIRRSFLFVLFAAACASPGTDSRTPSPTRSTVRVMDYQTAEIWTEGLETSTILPVSPAEVWAALPSAYERLGIPVGESSPNRMTLGNPGFKTRSLDGKRMSHYFDCGRSNSGPRANLYDVTITISTRIVDAPETGAVVATTIDAWARPRMMNGNPVHCLSRVTLEKRLVEAVAEEMGLGRPARSR